MVDVGKKHDIPTPMNDLIVDIVHAKDTGTIPVNASCKALFEAKLAEIETASNVTDHVH